MAVFNYGTGSGSKSKNVQAARQAVSNVLKKAANTYVNAAASAQKTATTGLKSVRPVTVGSTNTGQVAGASRAQSQAAQAVQQNFQNNQGSGKPSVRTDMDSKPTQQTSGGNEAADLAQVYQNYIDQLRGQANSAYGLNMERIRQGYDTNKRTLENSYADARNQLQSAYDKSAGDVRADSEQALRDSYINYMLSKKNMGQEMSALGLNGGAAESTLGSMLNTYGNSRNAIEQTRNKNLANLGDALTNGMSEASSNYNTALQNLINGRISAENAAENARQNLLANFATNISDLTTSNENYINLLRSVGEAVKKVQTNTQGATNPYQGIDLQQGSAGLMTPGAAVPANYAKYLSQARLMRQNGSSEDDIRNYLMGSVGSDATALKQIFAELGLA